MDAILAFAGLTKAYLLDIGIGEAEARAIAEQYDMIYDANRNNASAAGRAILFQMIVDWLF